jgi:hypothetical protein
VKQTCPAPRFALGDHLRVWRPLGPLGYYHHGIYLGEDRVVQFGGSIFDKRHATVGVESIAAFERSGIAQVVRHGGRTWWGAPRCEAIPPDKTVQRAKRLAEDHPHGLYDLFGYNCEQAANFCSTNSYESYQVRGYFAVRWLIGGPLLLYVAVRSRGGRPFSRLATGGLVLWMLLGVIPNTLYYLRGARFMSKIGRPLLDWERDQQT